MNECVVKINGVSWTESGLRPEKPCDECKMLTRGRINRNPFCLDCGMRKLLQPIKDARMAARQVFER